MGICSSIRANTNPHPQEPDKIQDIDDVKKKIDTSGRKTLELYSVGDEVEVQEYLKAPRLRGRISKVHSKYCYDITIITRDGTEYVTEKIWRSAIIPFDPFVYSRPDYKRGIFALMICLARSTSIAATSILRIGRHVIWRIFHYSVETPPTPWQWGSFRGGSASYQIKENGTLLRKVGFNPTHGAVMDGALNQND